jgi:hypothetical protein
LQFQSLKCSQVKTKASLCGKIREVFRSLDLGGHRASGAQDHLSSFRPAGAGGKEHSSICSVAISDSFFV